jgi:hypothetical protein
MAVTLGGVRVNIGTLEQTFKASLEYEIRGTIGQILIFRI